MSKELYDAAVALLAHFVAADLTLSVPIWTYVRGGVAALLLLPMFEGFS
jgi:hypothetical protein